MRKKCAEGLKNSYKCYRNDIIFVSFVVTMMLPFTMSKKKEEVGKKTK